MPTMTNSPAIIRRARVEDAGAMSLLIHEYVAVGTLLISPRMHAASVQVQETQAAMSTRAQESFAGVRVVKSFAREEREVEAFRESAERSRVANLRSVNVQAIFYPVIGLMKGLGYGRGYEYPHDAPEQFVATRNLPEALADERFQFGRQPEVCCVIGGQAVTNGEAKDHHRFDAVQRNVHRGKLQ